MKKEYLSNLVCMLQNQLKEEEENYYRQLSTEKSSLRLWQIKQRIKSLNKLLQAVESRKETENSYAAPAFFEIL